MSGTIRATVVDRLDLSVFEVSGRAPVDEYVRVIETHFPIHKSKNALWDLTQADLSYLDKSGISRIVDSANVVARYRDAGGRTAIVATRDVELVLLKIYSSLNELQGSTITYRVYDDLDDALAWFEPDYRPMNRMP